MMGVPQSRGHVRRWVKDERDAYADKKYNDKADIDRHMAEDGFTEDGWYVGFITNYLRRAQLLGADTSQGRQALGKCLVTITEALESSVRVYGSLPKPGVPSGTIEVQ